MVAIYLRVSTDNQATGLESQKRAIIAYCEARAITAYTIFEDEGYSGAKASRPGLDKLMNEVAAGQVSSVIVYSFSRFARSVKQLMEALELFDSRGVSFVSISENLDTNSSTGRFVFTILAALAALERQIIIERVNNGLANARAKGRRLGRPKLHNNEKVILHLAQQHVPQKEIARIAGCSAATVSRTISKVAG